MARPAILPAKRSEGQVCGTNSNHIMRRAMAGSPLDDFATVSRALQRLSDGYRQADADAHGAALGELRARYPSDFQDLPEFSVETMQNGLNALLSAGSRFARRSTGPLVEHAQAPSTGAAPSTIFPDTQCLPANTKSATPTSPQHPLPRWPRASPAIWDTHPGHRLPASAVA